MSGATCTCFSGRSPLGLPSCVSSFGKDTTLITMDERASDGTYNEIALTDLVDGKLPQSFIDAKLNHADPTKLWSMSAQFNIVDPVRAETIKEEIGGKPFPVRPGNLIWTGTIVAPPAYLKALETHTCGTNRVFFTVDAAGNLKGKKVLNSAGEWVLRGRKIENGTMDPMYNEGTKDEKEKVMLSFMVAETEKDSDFSFLSVGSMSFNFHSLQQIYVTVLKFEETLTTTEFVFSASNQFGSFGKENHVTGLLVADVDFYNETTLASITLTSLVETEPTDTAAGYYTATAAAPQTGGDVIRLSLDKDYYYADSITGTIPT